MKRGLLLLFAAMIVAGPPRPIQAQSAEVVAPAPSVAVDDALRDAIALFETWVESRMNYQSLPGMSVAVVHDQDLVWARGFGWSDVQKRAPADSRTIYRIGSITKLFTATAILQLQERGLLRVDDPVIKYLPWFTVKSPAGSPLITIRNLLSHTSGLPGELSLSYWTDGQFPTVEQIQHALQTEELTFPPETKLMYSNLGFSVLGQVVSAVSGQSYEKYIESSILKPLGMASTSVFMSEGQRARLATGYGRRMPDGTREVRPFENLLGLAPAGNISSTVEDLARFLSTQFLEKQQNGPRILKTETWLRMYRPQALLPDWRGGFGLGFMVRNAGGTIIVGHEGSLSGFHSRIRMDPKDKIGVIVLANADDAEVTQVADQALQIFGSALRQKSPAEPASPQRKQWEKYVGKYRSSWGDLQVLFMNDQLAMIDPNEEDVSSIKQLHPLGGNKFRIEGGHIDEDGELVEFEGGSDGKIIRMKVGATYVMKLP